MHCYIRVGKWGKSAALRFPLAIAEGWRLQPGQQLEAIFAAGDLVLRPTNPTPSLEKSLGHSRDLEWPDQCDYVLSHGKTYFVLSKGVYNRIEGAAIVCPIVWSLETTACSVWCDRFEPVRGGMVHIDRIERLPLLKGEFEVRRSKYDLFRTEVLRKFQTLF